MRTGREIKMLVAGCWASRNRIKFSNTQGILGLWRRMSQNVEKLNTMMGHNCVGTGILERQVAGLLKIEYEIRACCWWLKGVEI
jgi:hypothetical protein